MPRDNETNRRKIFFVPVILSVIVATILFAGCDSPSTGPSVTSSTKPGAPPSVVGNVPQSLEQFKGKVIVLDLWATWCPPCVAEIPGFISLQEKYRDQGLEIVGVSLDPVDSRGAGGAAAVGPFMQKMRINYTVWMVNNMQALGKYPLGQGYPTTYIISRDGRTVRQYVGRTPVETFESEIKALL